MPLTRKAPARFYTSKEVLTELGNVGFMKEKLSLKYDHKTREVFYDYSE
jgi:hypothetical protein